MVRWYTERSNNDQTKKKREKLPKLTGKTSHMAKVQSYLSVLLALA